MGENDHVITAYRDHGHALAVGMGMNECMAELFGKAHRLLEGQGRLDALLRAGQELLGRPRHRRRPDAARPRPRLRPEIQGPQGLLPLLPRRRRGEPGRLPRVPEPRRALRSAGHLHHRKQRLLDGHQPEALLAPIHGCLAERAEGYDIEWEQSMARTSTKSAPRPRSPSSARTTRCKPTHPRNRHLPLLRPLASPTRSTRTATAPRRRSRHYKHEHDPDQHLAKRTCSREGVLTEAQFDAIDKAATTKPRPPRSSPRRARSPSHREHHRGCLLGSRQQDRSRPDRPAFFND